ncbi:hypothetical protein NPIL_567241 [Nephila pilipes]|uniref:Uncharacterized protein n=1 Tax=Nephila pilipes TaxID=299642 RepID=A0A8X6TSS2_NEPPI|nr:hypothetical protein NPIL_567241 [Nephila pilipes]
MGAKTAILREVRHCVIYARFRSEFSRQIMADFPAAKEKPGRTFLKDWRDFAGPFLITSRCGRGVSLSLRFPRFLRAT